MTMGLRCQREKKARPPPVLKIGPFSKLVCRFGQEEPLAWQNKAVVILWLGSGLMPFQRAKPSNPLALFGDKIGKWMDKVLHHTFGSIP